LAQDEAQAPIPFEGGTFTITQTPDIDKILAFDGKELARNYVVYYDRTIELRDIKVALFAVGDGGNQCGPATLLVWKPKDGDIQTETVGEECGAPPAAATEDTIYFVPYVLPGETDPVEAWSLDKGLTVAGAMSYAPQPGTDWKDLDRTKLYNIVDAFQNAAVYAAGQKLLGPAMTDVVTGLLVGGGTEVLPSGAFYASGCVPHACGGSDTFMAIDPGKRALYLAQQSENPSQSTWPRIEDWPAELREAKEAAIGQ
jgi:hypothetical protein